MTLALNITYKKLVLNDTLVVSYKCTITIQLRLNAQAITMLPICVSKIEYITLLYIKLAFLIKYIM